VRLAICSLDRAAQRGALHPNNADGRKVRLMRRYNAALATVEAAAAAAAAKAEAKPARGRKSQGAKGREGPRQGRAGQEAQEVAGRILRASLL
jgi:hypothetical protein